MPPTVGQLIALTKQKINYLENNLPYNQPLQVFQILNQIQTKAPELITPRLLARITKFLLQIEINPGGPYTSDPATNRAVDTFLSTQNIKLEGLKNYLKEFFPPKPASRGRLYNHLARQAETSVRYFPQPTRTLVKNKIREMIDGDHDQQIMLLPYFFKLALGAKGQKISFQTIQDLGLANLFLWLAYTNYDNIIDGDSDIKTLPLANWFLKEFARIYGQQKQSANFKRLYLQISAQTDYAQIWELEKSRFQPGKKNIFASSISYQKPSTLYRRSLAHSLGPLLLLDQIKFPPATPEAKTVLSFFKYYLASRQLWDDIHDFESDTKRGIITAANIRVLKNVEDPKRYQEYFLCSELPRLTQKVDHYQNLAQAQIQEATIIKYPVYLEKLLAPLKQQALALETETGKINEFLKAYKNG